MLHRVILLVLSLAMPFQGAIGATGLLCGPIGHHESNIASAPHVHDAADSDAHPHTTGVLSANEDVAAELSLPDSQDLNGKCKTCSECGSSAAAVTPSKPAVFPSDTPLRVSPVASASVASRGGDGLFRPPRTTSFQ